MKLNVKLLRKVKKHILEEPKRLMMEDFVVFQSDLGGVESFTGDNNTKQKFAACGTAACIAGWTVVLTDGQKKDEAWQIEQRACNLLGLEYTRTTSPEFDSVRLFFVENWPKGMMSAYQKAKRPSTRAKIAAKRIDHFIATDGKE